MAKRRAKATAIYALIDPRTGLVRYIGKTRAAPRQRLSQHRSPGRRSQTPVARWGRKMREIGGKIEMVVLETVSERWQEAERAWIAAARAEGVDLLNVSPGGLQMEHVQEHRGKYPAYFWVMRFCGKNHLDELGDAMRELARQAREFGLMAELDDELRSRVLDAAPLTTIPPRPA